MDAAWAAVTAGAISALLTVSFSLLAVERRLRHDQAETRRLERRQAYSELLAYSGLLAQRARTLHLTMELRSGLKEGVDVLAGLRKPLDVFELDSLLRQDFEPIYRSWSTVWTIGSQEAISAANDLVYQAAVLLRSATQRGRGRPNWLRALAGETWTQEQLDTWAQEERSLGKSRREFNMVVRNELGSTAAEVFVVQPADGEA